MKSARNLILSVAALCSIAIGNASANPFVDAQNAAANAQSNAVQQQQANWQANWNATVRAQNAADTAQWNAMQQQQANSQSRASRGSESCDLLGIYGESCHHRAARINAENDRAKLAGSLIASGQCANALNFALKAGDFDLVNRVNSLCQTAPAATANQSVPTSPQMADSPPPPTPPPVEGPLTTGVLPPMFALTPTPVAAPISH